jgi:hypothetical protein
MVNLSSSRISQIWDNAWDISQIEGEARLGESVSRAFSLLWG